MKTRTLFAVLAATQLATGCAFQSASEDGYGGVHVQGYNYVLGNSGVPWGNYDAYWERGTWFRDGSGVVRRR